MTGSPHRHGAPPAAATTATSACWPGWRWCEASTSAGVAHRRPLAVAFFTNEEGARFQPDMLGSLVYAGGLAARGRARHAWASTAPLLGDELERIGYVGTAPCPGPARTPSSSCTSSRARCSSAEGVTIGAVHRRAGHLLAGAHDRRAVQPRRHHADARCATTPAWPRPRWPCSCAQLADRHRRQPGRHGRAHRAAPQPGQRDRRARRAHRRPAQHRRGVLQQAERRLAGP